MRCDIGAPRAMDELALTIDEEVGRTISMIDGLLQTRVQWGASEAQHALGSEKPFQIPAPMSLPSALTAAYANARPATLQNCAKHAAQSTQTQRRAVAASTQCRVPTRNKGLQADEAAAQPASAANAFLLIRSMSEQDGAMRDHLDELEGWAHRRLDGIDRRIARVSALVCAMKELAVKKSHEDVFLTRVEATVQQEERERHGIRIEESESWCDVFSDRYIHLRSRCDLTCRSESAVGDASRQARQPSELLQRERSAMPVPLGKTRQNNEDLTELLFECWDVLAAE